MSHLFTIHYYFLPSKNPVYIVLVHKFARSATSLDEVHIVYTTRCNIVDAKHHIVYGDSRNLVLCPLK